MQDYKTLLSSLNPLLKGISDTLTSAGKTEKKIQKDVDSGNLTDARKDLAVIQASIEQLQAKANAIQAEIDSFDTQAYFVSSEFEQQLLSACTDKGINIIGEKGVYEMFPYKIRIIGDEEHAAEVYMNRKKIPSYYPEYVADTIYKGIAKLNKAAFNTASFMEELAVAYEVTCLRTGARIGSTQSLTKVYRNLAPMSRARKDYDMQAFAFDLSRLYEAGTEAWCTKTDTYDFGTSRDGKSGIRVLSRTGVESFISTIRLLQKDS